jgi:tetratricopeptide (TPR) repeat protein
VASLDRFNAAAEGADQSSTHWVLLTQAARALGLAGRFEEATTVLADIPTSDPEVAVRVLLERGRVLNSGGAPGDARPVFEAAFAAAAQSGFEHLAIDALHMVAIVAPASEQVSLNSRALELAAAGSDPRAQQWRASLLNNLGWTRFDAGEFGAALALFEEALVERERQGKDAETGVARWCVARTYRALGRLEEALAAQRALAAWLSERGLPPDEYVAEEIAACEAELQKDDAASR